MDEIRGASAFGFHDVAYSFDFKSVVERKNAVVQQLRSGVEGLLAHKMINFVRGRAYFKDADTVCVDADGEVMEFYGRLYDNGDRLRPGFSSCARGRSSGCADFA